MDNVSFSFYILQFMMMRLRKENRGRNEEVMDKMVINWPIYASRICYRHPGVDQRML